MNLTTALKPLFQRSQPQQISSGFSLFGGVTTKSGTPVNQKTALTLSAFYNAVEIITNDFAKLPKSVFQKQADSRIKLSDHPVNYLISKRPNQYMTAIMFDKVMILNAILKGNGYAIIERNNAGIPVALQLIDQDKHPVQVVEYNNKLFYKVNDTVYAAADMLHIPGFSFNGITGISVITAAANSLGVNLNSQEYAAEYYNSKGIGTGVVTSSVSMTDDAKSRLGSALASVFNNKENYKIPIIDEAAQFQHINITPQESQFIQTHKQGVEEIARWLNISIHKLKVLDNINNSITENLEIQHISDSVLPWAIKFEQEYSTKLFTPREIAANIYIKANINALLRSDTKTKGEYFGKAISWGWLTRNEVRALEELNPLDGLDEPLTPVNTMTQEQINKTLNDEQNN